MAARNKIGTEVTFRSTKGADRNGRMEALMTSVPVSTQRPNSIICPHRAKKTKASLLLHYNDEESISSDEHRENS